MVQDIISYAGQTLITIYHKGFDTNIGAKKNEYIEKVGRYNLKFNEKVVPDNDATMISGWAWKFEGLLENNEEKNPYGESACVYMEEYVYINKPDRIFSIKEDEYLLKISIEQLQQINEFVKKYTGLSIERNPMCYGNIIVYDSCVIEYHAKQEEGIVVSEVRANTMVIVRFKMNKVVVSTKIVKVSQLTKNLEIISEKKWNCHDIEVYKDDELIYIAKDISYMRRMSLNMHIGGQGKRIKLDKLTSEFVMKNNGSGETTIIRDKADELEELEELYNKSNYSIANRLKQEVDDNMVVFINPGEINKAMKLITDFLQSQYNEIWIFDAYFTDKNKIAYTIDWMRIIAYCGAESKKINIVFYCKNNENAYGVDEITQHIVQDSVIRDVLKNKKSLGVSLYQTKSPIHDRFIITNHEGKYSGLAIGTSFNSLGENHYCIYKLSHVISRNIWNDLKMWLENGNIIDLGKV
ncbi:hypothetical protein [Clostridium estertheticum]|uniref:hypothetical protein n=1 Tax=Clostridium estertheticum TaxID=238834 RepID=UPI001CF2AE48|nr:hypothetical protein [Clostridium estertheticum]MCB2343299.1 hypothetical protein [Clostridium estertheticum]